MDKTGPLVQLTPEGLKFLHSMGKNVNKNGKKIQRKPSEKHLTKDQINLLPTRKESQKWEMKLKKLLDRFFTHPQE